MPVLESQAGTGHLWSPEISNTFLQHLSSLLAAPDKEVVEAALQTLVAFLRKTHGSSVRWHGSSDLNSRLLALSQGWGVKELVSLAASLLDSMSTHSIITRNCSASALTSLLLHRASIWQLAPTVMRLASNM